MIIRKTVEMYWQEDEDKYNPFEKEDRKYLKNTYWFLFIPVYTTYEIISYINS